MVLIASSIYYFTSKLKVESELKNISRYECLIMGDSQMQRIKPEFSDVNAFNFASSGEHYYFTYQKIKRLIGFKNHKIKSIIIGLSAHSFCPAYIRIFNKQFSEGRDSFIRYFYFFNKDNNNDLLTKSTFKGIYSTPDWGGLKISQFKEPDTSVIDKTFKIHYETNKNENMYDSKQAKYLTRIDSICRANDITLFAVSLPYHPAYLSKIDSLYMNILNEAAGSLPNTIYINYLNQKINPNLMSDANHLNSEGADIYSKMIFDMVAARTETSP